MIFFEDIEVTIRTKLKSAGLQVILLLVVGYTAAAQEWELKKSSSGINIYTKSQQNTDVKALKADFEANGNVRQLANLLLDVVHQPDWVYSTSSATIVKRLSNYELIYYTEKKMPWPLSNRDVVMQMRLVVDTVASTLLMTAHSVANIVPVKSGIVRVPASEVTWKVSTLRPGTMKIEYTAQADPGGAVPAWVTNAFLTKGPYETFTNLRKQLANKGG